MKEQTELLSIMKCRDCGELVVVINCTRLSSHKCSGRWVTVKDEYVDPGTITGALSDKDQPVIGGGE